MLSARPTRFRAYILADAVFALVIAGILITTLGVAIGASRRGLAKLNDSRHATRIAEDVLTDLQLGRTLSDVSPEDVKVRVADVAGAPGAPAGRRWVIVTVNVRRSTSTLTGLVPQAFSGEKQP